MPTYEYECLNGHSFEEFQSIVAAPVEVCPICGGKAQRKISGGSGLIFKGTGFYLTDYGRKNVSPADARPSKKDESAKTESKPESAPAKTETTTPKSSSDGGKSGSA